MKRLILSMFVLCGMAQVQAQGISSVAAELIQPTEEVKQDTETVRLQNALHYNFQLREDAFGVGFDWQFGWVNFGGGMYFGESNSIDFQGWDINLGISRHLWLNDVFYVSANGGFAYYHGESNYYDSFTNQSYSNKSNNLGAYIMPRAGVSLYKDKEGFRWNLFVAYRWDWPDFNFELEDNGYLVLGLSMLL